ncbi:MAG: universal stress protein [Dehalococcoidia bacterium]|nr:universal stress protein [Dehalococcoidia bacterium]
MFKRGTKTREDDLHQPLARIRDILVPIDGKRVGYEALNLACSIAKRNKGTVYVAHVIEVRRSLPLDAEMGPEAEAGERILATAERVAAEQDFTVRGELLQSREAGSAIADEATDRAVDAIILGVAYKAPYGDFEPGRTAQYLLKNAPCEVWLLRAAQGEAE